MLLYALFYKFGDDSSKKRFKEVAEVIDFEEWFEEVKIHLLMKQLIKKFKIVLEEYKNK